MAGWLRGALLLLFFVISVDGNMVKPTFGKAKWGQDKSLVFITIYIPGINAKKLGDMLKVTNESFSFVAIDPEDKKPSKLAFDFREPVDSSSLIARPGTWKYGNSNNTVFITVIRTLHTTARAAGAVETRPSDVHLCVT